MAQGPRKSARRSHSRPSVALLARYRILGPYLVPSGTYHVRIEDIVTGVKWKMATGQTDPRLALVAAGADLRERLAQDSSDPVPVSRDLALRIIRALEAAPETATSLAPQQSPTFADAWEEYIRFKVEEGQVTDGGEQLASDGKGLKTHFRGRVHEIQGPDIDAWLSSLRRQGKAPGTRRKLLSFLRAFFGWARLRRAYCAVDPTEGFTVRAQKTRPTRALTIEEARRLLAAAPSHHVWAALFVALRTGLRREKAVSLSWEQVDLETGILKIPAEGTRKYHSDLVLPLHQELLEWLRKLPRDRPIVGRDHAQRTWAATLKRAGLSAGDGVKFHSTRYAVKSWLTDAGVDPTIRDLLLGHRSQEVARLYEQPARETLRAAINALPRLL